MSKKIVLRTKFGPQLDKRGRLVCSCTGYWFPHRKGGGACEHSRTRDICMARRHGDAEALMDALIEFDLNHPKATKAVATSAACPF